jgi:DNA polymerase-3 subunit gamma/tau
MAYQVIARKYRPRRFCDVVGQDHVTTTLAHAIEQKRIAHAYLFCGPRGTGKTTVARIFAKCLNCTGGPRLDFADDDLRCIEIAEGRSLDVLEIDGASNRGIDEIRALRDTVKYAPAAAQFKVYIIDEVHMLTKEAFNALLKTLEEPPAHVKFLFATTEPEKVLPTILSRCQRFDLRRIPAALIVQHLVHIAKQEKTRIGEAALYAIARGADGGMRDAESTLDQLISFCGEKIEESDVLSMFGMAAQGQIRELFRALMNNEAQVGLQLLDELCRSGKDLGRLLADLLAHGRHLLLTVVSQGKPSWDNLPEAEVESLKEEASQVTVAELTRVMEVLADGERRLRDAASRRIVFEVTLLKAMEARRAIGVDDLLRQLQQLRGEGAAQAPDAKAAGAGSRATAQPSRSEPRRRSSAKKVSSGRSPSPAPLSTPPGSAAQAEESTPRATQASAQVSSGDTWNRLMESLSVTNKFLQTYLSQAHPVGLDRDVFTIGYDPKVSDQLELVNTDRNREVILERLTELGLTVHRVRFVEAKAPEGMLPPLEPPRAESADTSASAPSPETPARFPAPAAKPKQPAAEPVVLDKASFENDPLIKKALEIFRGQIVEIRP